MTIQSNITYPKASDIPELANELIAALAKAMIAEGNEAQVAVMRHDVVTTICEYYPWAYRANRKIPRLLSPATVSVAVGTGESGAGRSRPAFLLLAMVSEAIWT